MKKSFKTVSFTLAMITFLFIDFTNPIKRKEFDK